MAGQLLISLPFQCHLVLTSQAQYAGAGVMCRSSSSLRERDGGAAAEKVSRWITSAGGCVCVPRGGLLLLGVFRRHSVCQGAYAEIGTRPSTSQQKRARDKVMPEV
jgi:hypothetical protein